MSPAFPLAPLPQNEAARLAALQALNILDTPPEAMFDEAAQVAAAICGTPIALVNLLDADRQWFKARVGIAVTEATRRESFCDHTIGQTTPLVVGDTTSDDRFCTSHFVTGDAKIRFYAGMPLNTTDGFTIGTLCVTDVVPHQLTEEQTEALAALGRQVAAQIELRSKVQLLGVVLAEKDRVERELRERTLLFGAFMDHSPTVAFIKDREGRFLYYNRVFGERFGVAPKEWIGKRAFDVFSQEFAAACDHVDQVVLTTGTPQIVEETSPGPEGTTVYWRTHKFRISDGDETVLLGAVSLDISYERKAAMELQRSHTQLEAANQQLMELSVTDGLTNLRNRRSFDERLALEVHGQLPLSLLLLDIDHFKKINDTYGHSFGDEVLRIVAHLLQKNSRVPDDVARFGGEEFAILLPGIGARQARTIAERLRAAVADFEWKRKRVTLSVGVATRTISADSEADLILAADEALYCAKSRGRNRVESAGVPVPIEAVTP